MHVISYRRLREFSEQHSDAGEALDNWYKIASKATWLNLVDVQKVFPKAEAVSNFTVFNIKGNRYRLIASIDYKGQLIGCIPLFILSTIIDLSGNKAENG